MLLNKKGISPLIATILVIGITVVIAVLITTWLRGTTGGLQCTQECQISGASACQYSFDDLEASFSGSDAVITNTGSREYSYTVVWLDGTGSSTSVDSSLTSAGYDTQTSSDAGESFRVIAGIIPVVDDCGECDFVQCWESDEILAE